MKAGRELLVVVALVDCLDIKKGYTYVGYYWKYDDSLVKLIDGVGVITPMFSFEVKIIGKLKIK